MSRPIAGTALSVLCLLLQLWLAPAAAGAPAPHAARALDLLGAAFPIADYPDLVSAAADLAQPSLAYNPRRPGYLALWQGYMGDTGFNIYAREISPLGVPSTTLLTICDQAADQLDPHLAYHYAGDQYWAVWEDARSGTGESVYARRLSAAGVPTGTETLVSRAGNPAYYPRVSCSTDRCVIAWVEEVADSAEVYARAYDAGGSPLTAVTRISAEGIWATHVDLAANGSGQYLIVWEEWNPVGEWDISAQLVSATLAPLGSAIEVTAAAQDQWDPRVAYSPVSDRFCVVWNDARSQATDDIYAQLLTAAGQLQGSALVLYSGPGGHQDPTIAAHATADQFLVLSTADVASVHTAPAVRALTVTGSGATSAVLTVRSAGGWRSHPALACGADGYLTVWEEGYFGDDPDLVGQRVTPGPGLQGGLLPVCISRKGQEHPAAAYNSQDNQYLVVWQDFRTRADYEIYGRILSATGQRLGQELVIGTEGLLSGDPVAVYNPLRHEYWVVWDEIRGGGTTSDISAQRLDAAGQKLGASLWVSRDTGAGSESGARVAANTISGEYLLVWQGWTGSGWDVFARRVSGEGVLLGSGVILGAPDLSDYSPRVLHNPQANEYLLVWKQQSGGEELHARRLAADGTLLGDERVLASTADLFGQFALLRNSVGNEYLLLWDDWADDQVHGQRFDPALTPLGAAFVLPDGNVWAGAFSAVFDPCAGEYLLVGETYQADTGWDIHGARLSADGGTVIGTFPVAAVAEVQSHPALAHNTVLSQALIVWQDFSAGSEDIYGQLWQGRHLSADLDCDCDVDIVDIMRVASRWSTVAGDPRYDPLCDLDLDGDIDIVDIMRVATHWSETCAA